MTIYAEQLLQRAEKNQFFLMLHMGLPTWNPSVLAEHMAWFEENQVATTLVAAMGEHTPRGKLYHVAFEDGSDPKLHDYMKKFEDDLGASLQPNQYQMLEWSYEGWVKQNGPEEFDSWLQSQNNSNKVTGP